MGPLYVFFAMIWRPLLVVLVAVALIVVAVKLL